MGGVAFFGAILVLMFGAVIAKEFQNVATDKGYVGDKYFWYPFLFGIFGMLLVVTLPDRKGNVQAPSEPVAAQEAPASAADEIPDL